MPATSGSGQPNKLGPSPSTMRPPVQSGHLPIAVGAKRVPKRAVKSLHIKKGR